GFGLPRRDYLPVRLASERPRIGGAIERDGRHASVAEVGVERAVGGVARQRKLAKRGPAPSHDNRPVRLEDNCVRHFDGAGGSNHSAIAEGRIWNATGGVPGQREYTIGIAASRVVVAR